TRARRGRSFHECGAGRVEQCEERSGEAAGAGGSKRDFARRGGALRASLSSGAGAVRRSGAAFFAGRCGCARGRPGSRGSGGSHRNSATGGGASVLGEKLHSRANRWGNSTEAAARGRKRFDSIRFTGGHDGG